MWPFSSYPSIYPPVHPYIHPSIHISSTKDPKPLCPVTSLCPACSQYTTGATETLTRTAHPHPKHATPIPHTSATPHPRRATTARLSAR
eukprot:361948-Chlamydomonas_euryale.AAC.3